MSWIIYWKPNSYDYIDHYEWVESQAPVEDQRCKEQIYQEDTESDE